MKDYWQLELENQKLVLISATTEHAVAMKLAKMQNLSQKVITVSVMVMVDSMQQQLIFV